MANPWFKMHADIIHNARLRLLKPSDRWRYTELLALKCSGLLDTDTDADLLKRLVAVSMSISTKTLTALAQRLEQVGLIDAQTLQPLNWHERQYLDDDGQTPEERNREQSRERMRKLRERNKTESVTDDVTHDVTQASVTVTPDVTQASVTVTPRFANVTLPDTDTDTETDTEGTDNTTGLRPVAAHAPARVTPDVTPDVTQASVTVTPDVTQPKPDKPSNAKRKKSELSQRLLGVDDVVARGVERQYALDWMAVRKAKGCGLTASELEANEREAANAGISFAQAVQLCAENSWRGFRAMYWHNLQNRNLPHARASPRVNGALTASIQPDMEQAFAIAEQNLFGVVIDEPV